MIESRFETYQDSWVAPRNPRKVLIFGEFPVQALPAPKSLASLTGGTCTWLLALARAWEAQQEIDLHWAVFAKEISTKVEIRSWGQTFHVLPTSSCFRMRGFYSEDRKTLANLVRAIDPEVVHGWGSEDIYGWAAALSERPHLVSVQGILRNYVRQAALFHPKVYLLAFLEKYLFRRAQILTAETRWGERQIRRFAPGANIRILEYGIQNLFFSTPWNPQAPSAAIFVGTIDRNKGIADLVEAFRSPELAGHELWVVGTGGRFAQQLKASAPEAVKWLGRLSPEETARTMARATCLALPTRKDNSPNVVKEARAIGIPVLTTARGGQAAYLADGEDGYLLEPGDVRKTCRALVQILQNPSRARDFGKKGHQRYGENFRAAKTADGIFSIYRELAARSSP